MGPQRRGGAAGAGVSWIKKLARADIVALKTYEPVASTPGFTRLHANELPWRHPRDESAAGLNRYPETQPRALLERLASLYRVGLDSILPCRGSNDAIDLLVRAFCRAGEDAVVHCPPTFGMYAHAARVQGAKVLSVPLKARRGFALDTKGVLARRAEAVKIVFLCSPNNPTGNLLSEAAILEVADALAEQALVVVDEAYVEFSRCESLARHLAQRPQLVILRTLSKARGLAGVRCGALIAHPEVIALTAKVMPPCAISQLTLEIVLSHLVAAQLHFMDQCVAQVIKERARLESALHRIVAIREVYPSEANFILARLFDAGSALERARVASVLVRDARGHPELPDALRISVGTPEENDRLLEAWA